MSKSKFAMLEIPSSFIRIRFSSDGQSILVISNIVFFIQIAVFIGITLPLYISAIRNIFLFCSSLNITKHLSTSSPPPQQQSPPRLGCNVNRLCSSIWALRDTRCKRAPAWELIEIYYLLGHLLPVLLQHLLIVHNH